MDNFNEYVTKENNAQIAKWGVQYWPDGTGESFLEDSLKLKEDCDQAFAAGVGTWRHILHEEILEAFVETDLEKLKYELIQSAAVIKSWITDIDRRLNV